MHKTGYCWIIYERSRDAGKRKFLLSILSYRTQQTKVFEYMNQLYVDKYGDFEDKINFKNRKLEKLYWFKYCDKCSLIVGYDPEFRAFYGSGYENNSTLYMSNKKNTGLDGKNILSIEVDIT